MPNHSIDDNNPCSHNCTELLALSFAFEKLLSSTLDLIDQQHGLDPTTLPISQAIDYLKSFVQFHPTMTISTLIGGIDVSAEAIAARVLWEKGENE